MSKYFITFGGGGINYIEATNRIVNQAKSIELFDIIIGYTDKDLKNDKFFWNKHSKFIKNNKRGYGYWLWKPYLIKKTMDMMKDGDILLYLDCGCEIDINKKNIINEHFNNIKNEYIIGTLAQVEKKWCKMDLILKLDMLDNKYLDSIQHQGGVVMYLVCEKTRSFVNEWYEICCDYHMIDDSPSINPNFDCFIEHRHDQSIYSLLVKKYNLSSEIYNLEKCIEVIRNKTGISQI